jgi:7-cyano-7-deazaguanine synthase in queuosine biosynthesis
MRYHIRRFLLATIILPLLLIACGGSRDETISGVAIPVPNAMKKSAEKPVEISFFGVGAGQASFRGDMESEKLVEFYKKEMPARGWQSNMSLLSGGAMLAYSKDAKTVMIGIGKQDNQSVLSLTVGTVGK